MYARESLTYLALLAIADLGKKHGYENEVRDIFVPSRDCICYFTATHCVPFSPDPVYPPPSSFVIATAMFGPSPIVPVLLPSAKKPFRQRGARFLGMASLATAAQDCMVCVVYGSLLFFGLKLDTEQF